MRFAFGDGAGFIKHNCGEFRCHFQAFAIADEYASFGSLAGADHDRRRGRQTQGAGAGDEQHSDGCTKRKAGTSPRRHPPYESECGNAHDRWHENGGDLIDHFLDGQFASLGLIDHAHDAG